ncbi:MAG: bifunctional aspartokinase / homoserine dehydrogenase 1, partial [Acidobacteriota bacterium]|nr:bifunctional aspartokinase / homoserine dehydrogenase 1 [Acidobacteriota bacterium]
EVLRYVGTIEPGGRVSAALRPFPLEHPFASLSESDNVVSFRTARYNVQQMIVRGPGAGPDVTAAGVFADLLRLASFLGAPQ